MRRNLPFRIIDQSSLIVYLGGAEKPLILRVYVEEKSIKEDHKIDKGQQDIFNDEFDLVDLNNSDDEIGISVCEGEREGEGPDLERNSSPTPMVGSKSPCASQSLRVNNVGDNEIGSYKEMTFKNKQELTNSLKIACLKKKI